MQHLSINILLPVFKKNISRISIYIAFCLLTNMTVMAGELPSTIICGLLGEGFEPDTITLKIQDEFLISSSPRVLKTYTQVVYGAEFKFSIPDIKGPVYITLNISSKVRRRFGRIIEVPLIDSYVIRSGDSVYIRSADLNNIVFSGKGSEKMQCWYELQRSAAMKKLTLPSTRIADNLTRTLQFIANFDTIAHLRLDRLNAYGQILPAEDFKILKADVIGEDMYILYDFMLATRFESGHPEVRRMLMKRYQEIYLNQQPDTSFANLNALSPWYIKALFYKTLTDDCFFWVSQHPDKPYLPRTPLFEPLIEQKFKGVLRDKLLVHWMYWQISATSLSEDHLKHLLEVVEAPAYRAIVKATREIYGENMPVIDFAFKDAQDRTVHLSDFKGKVIFLDMWFTGCGACISVAKALPKVESTFKNDDVVFISLSIDSDRETWMNSISKVPPVVNGRPHYAHYTTATTRYLYTGGSGSNNEFIQRYVPSNTYPHLLLIGRNQQVFSANPPRPDSVEVKDAPGQLINLIRQALVAY